MNSSNMDRFEFMLWFQMKTAADVCVLYDINKKQKP